MEPMLTKSDASSGLRSTHLYGHHHSVFNPCNCRRGGHFVRLNQSGLLLLPLAAASLPSTSEVVAQI